MATRQTNTASETDFAWTDTVIDAYALMAATLPETWAVTRGVLFATNPLEIAEVESRAVAIQRAHHYTSIVETCLDKSDRPEDFAKRIGEFTDAMLALVPNLCILKVDEKGSRGTSDKFLTSKAVIEINGGKLGVHFQRPVTK